MSVCRGFIFFVEDHEIGKRLDILIASRISEISRSRVAFLIENGMIRVDGSVKKPGYRVNPNEKISGNIPLPKLPDIKPEPIPIQILYEDSHLVVVNKQAGIVVHPGPGHPSGTLVNGLLYHCQDFTGIGDELRPGIVHRLDKDTSGVLVVAKDELSHRNLSFQFKSRNIEKNYLALVYGKMTDESGVVSFKIGRHPVDRKKMSIKSRNGRTALTLWRVLECFGKASLLDLNLKTGRTHQIRVHCAAIHHPIIGDPVYGRRGDRKHSPSLSASTSVVDSRWVRRQMLHARRIQFKHPVTQETLTVDAPVPKDMEMLIDALRRESDKTAE